MNKFGDALRDLRLAQESGLRETAVKAGISPAYLSRIERGKERPPSADVIKALARVLAADPDVLFRLASSTDPDISAYLNESPELMRLVRLVHESSLTSTQINSLIREAERISQSSTRP